MSEKWADIPNFKNYQVSNIGNVKNSRGKILLQDTDKCGYRRVTLYSDGKPKHFVVHKLVALCFIPNPYNFPCVNHKDENPSNNAVENLEWCTYSHNINYGNRTYKVRQHARKVAQCDFNGNVLATYISVNFAADIMKVDPSNIYKCCRGELAHIYGFKWQYI